MSWSRSVSFVVPAGGAAGAAAVGAAAVGAAAGTGAAGIVGVRSTGVYSGVGASLVAPVTACDPAAVLPRDCVGVGSDELSLWAGMSFLL
jgi:hypothetical protein